ncbi:unnamed protein product [Withania somnifera]
MPGVTSESDDLAMVPVSLESENQPAVMYPLRHGLKSPIHRLSISWACGNTLRVSVFQKPQSDTAKGDSEAGERVVEVKLSNSVDEEADAARWRRMAYSSVTPFALLQSRKNSLSAASRMSLDTPPYKTEGWEHVIEYSKEISSLLSDQKPPPRSIIEDPKSVVNEIAEPMCLKAAWELLEIFYIDKQSHSWIPERLLDWLADYNSLFSGTRPTIHSKLVDFQQELVRVQAVEEDPSYWDAMSSVLAVGWLETVVKLLRLHGSYQFDQLSSRETENGLVEAVAVLISKMPRMRPSLREDNLGECYKTKPDFMKAWEKWRTQISKLDCSSYWLQCDHRQTREGLKNLIQIKLGNPTVLSNATFNWMELFISHFLYIRPFTAGLESMHNSAQKCMQLKPVSSPHELFGLILGILGENTEVVLAECSRSFGPWMMVHAVELLTAGSTNAEILFIEEMHRLVYAQVLSSHALTWQIAPIYLTSCIKQGFELLENLLYKQPVQDSQILLKSIEICRLYGLDTISSYIMRIAGVHHWKRGRKGSGVFWLQQARDEFRLSRIAKQLFDFVGNSVSDEGFKQWEGLIELLGSESRTAASLEFLNKYRDFRRSLLQVHGDTPTGAARNAAEALVSLMENPSMPPRFWLPLLYDSLKLLMWQERPLLNVSQTHLLLNKLQELSMERLRSDFVEADLPSDALSSVRLALATNLGRAILKE